jgi:hypothetical protein
MPEAPVAETAAPYPVDALSIFDFDPKQDAEAWERLFEAIGLDAKEKKWDRLMMKSGLSGKIGSVIVEHQYICKDHRSLHSNFYSKKFAASDPYCKRVHFFSDRLPLSSGSSQAVLTALATDTFAKSYIGYSVIKPQGLRVIGRTILDPNRLKKGIADGKYCLTADFKVHLAGTSLVAKGYPYISQDTEAMVCAHAAIWGACRFLSQKYRTYKEVYPYDIIRYANPRGGRSIPYRGMSYNDYSDIFTQFGCHPVLHGNTNIKKGGEEFHDIYAYVESGFPVLASNTKHVLSLIGHTLDPASKFTKTDGVINSSEFVNALIVVDDNHFPYREIAWADANVPVDINARGEDKKIYVGDLKHFVVPLPEKVYLTANRARSLFMRTLKGPVSSKFDQLLNPAREGDGLVVRQFITTGSAIRREAMQRYTDKKSLLFCRIVEQPMPHFVWVMELATLEGYKNHQCLGEIVIDATASLSARDWLLYMRVGDHACFSGDFTRVFSSKSETTLCKQFSHNLGSTNAIHN